MAGVNKKLFFEKPFIVEKLGEDLFLKIPIYKRKEPLHPLYLNISLYKSYIQSPQIDESELYNELKLLFQITTLIDKAESPLSVVGYAYVDKQVDPHSTTINPGSGRSYYFGKYFNLKGEITPFALTGDGLMNLEQGIFETISSNSLLDSTPFPVPPVMAILVREDYTSIIYEKKPLTVRNSIIIRVNVESSLERVSHLHYINKPINKSDLLAASTNFGLTEGTKFIERILHGMWSSGNISLTGSFLDMETMCSVKGRHPQFSATRYFKDNYFGFETLGQLKVLRALINNKRINSDSVLLDDVHSCFNKGLRTSLLHGFFGLMGFSNKRIATKFKRELTPLIDLFVFLSRKFYFNEKYFLANNPNSLLASVFDFSNFFRLYPLIKRIEPVQNHEQAFFNAILINEHRNSFYDDFFHFRKDVKTTKHINRQIYKKFFPYISRNSQFDIDGLTSEIRPFIKMYDQVHTSIMTRLKLKYEKIEANAYYINEDRKYLFASNKYMFTLASRYTEENTGRISRLINQIILANYRNFKYEINNKLPTNMHVYWEGFSCILLDKKGNMQIYLYLFDINQLADFNRKNLALFFQNTPVRFRTLRDKKNNSFMLISEKIGSECLLIDKPIFFGSDLYLSILLNNRPITLELLFQFY